MNEGVCRLCLNRRKLCNKSHIIPEFMYRDLFDEKHRVISLSREDKKQEFKQSGEHEKNILCEKCDNEVIGQYETYAKKVLYGGGKILVKTKLYRTNKGMEYIQAEGLDYKKFKLFLLSVLWRASISSNLFFTQVKLGPHEDKLRNIILSGNPGPISLYPCIITTYRRFKEIPHQLIVRPWKQRLDNIISYSFLVSGMMYIFKITEEEKTEWILETTINKQGRVKILCLTEAGAKKMISDLEPFPED